MFDNTKSNKKSWLLKYFNYIETIRHNNVPDRTALKNLVGVAWPTLQKALEDFNNEGCPIVLTQDGYFLNSDFSIHAGISVGATQIKLYLCDFNYKPLTLEFFSKNELCDVFANLKKEETDVLNDKNLDKGFFCYDSENTIEGISLRLKKIFTELIRIDDKALNLLSVGISFPGIINKESLTIDFSPNIKCLRNLSIKDLLSDELWDILDEKEISVFFEHDTQAASIFEKESFYNKGFNNHKYASVKNICCIYIAAGIGASLIIDNKLIRGCTNSFGEFAHTPAPHIYIADKPNTKLTEEEQLDKSSYYWMISKFDENNNIDNYEMNTKTIYPCECGKYACLESAFRRDVFDSYDLSDYLKKINNENEFEDFDKKHPYRYQVLKDYIKYMIGLLINFFNPELIVFSGRIMWEINKLESEFNNMRASSAIGIPAKKCDIILGTKKIYSAAAGAAISSYHCYVKGKSFCDISW